MYDLGFSGGHKILRSKEALNILGRVSEPQLPWKRNKHTIIIPRSCSFSILFSGPAKALACPSSVDPDKSSPFSQWDMMLFLSCADSVVSVRKTCCFPSSWQIQAVEGSGVVLHL